MNTRNYKRIEHVDDFAHFIFAWFIKFKILYNKIPKTST